MARPTLIELFKIYEQETDKDSIHSYGEVYEKLLAKYQDCENVLEIGIYKGGSLKVWERYFPHANVHGIDCDEQPHGGMADLRPMIASGKHNIHIMDATNQYEVAKKFEGVKFDVIVEDASHDVTQQVELYNLWKNYLSPNGIYIIEDVQYIDQDRHQFENLDSEKNIEILDRRQIKGRYDDVQIIIRNK